MVASRVKSRRTRRKPRICKGLLRKSPEIPYSIHCMLLTTTYLSSFILRRLTAGRMMKGRCPEDSAWATLILGALDHARCEVRIVVRLRTCRLPGNKHFAATRLGGSSMSRPSASVPQSVALGRPDTRGGPRRHQCGELSATVSMTLATLGLPHLLAAC